MNPVRGTMIVLEAPALSREACPTGTCHWCGELLIFTDDATWHNRQRVRHKGDEIEAGDTEDCDRAFRQSMVWTGQNALRWQAWRESPDNRYELHCVDCSELCEVGRVWVPRKRIGFATRQRQVFKPWNADHVVELQDDGAHSLENLRVRCTPCHKTKTKREIDRRIANAQHQIAQQYMTPGAL
jgi:5-methylcytosine-specific restriction endonuclease McrA